jgi:hypothetical protein
MGTEPLKKSASKQKWYRTSLFLSITIGIPFCIFKYLFGMLSVRAGIIYSNHFLLVFGQFVIVWAAIDVLLNVAGIIFNVLGKKSWVEFCLIAQIGSIFGRSALFLAIDTLLSFSIICFVLWSGWIKNLDLYESYLWYASTTLNLISISMVNIFSELHQDVEANKSSEIERK